VVERLLCKCEVMSSNPVPFKSAKPWVQTPVPPPKKKSVLLFTRAGKWIKHASFEALSKALSPHAFREKKVTNICCHLITEQVTPWKAVTELSNCKWCLPCFTKRLHRKTIQERVPSAALGGVETMEVYIKSV
jgi:hypothetical protein